MYIYNMYNIPAIYMYILYMSIIECIYTIFLQYSCNIHVHIIHEYSRMYIYNMYNIPAIYMYILYMDICIYILYMDICILVNIETYYVTICTVLLLLYNNSTVPRSVKNIEQLVS